MGFNPQETVQNLEKICNQEDLAFLTVKDKVPVHESRADVT